ncbi:MAG TPA: response regulator, partial [Micromonosporaceae bacterium]|nr:response regulator [Micromonosporaceae bacterium]
PFDPWVLRAKVSVFVELWTKTQQLLVQADAVREAAALLRSAPEDVPDVVRKAAALLDNARVAVNGR